MAILDFSLPVTDTMSIKSIRIVINFNNNVVKFCLLIKFYLINNSLITLYITIYNKYNLYNHVSLNI